MFSARGGFLYAPSAAANVNFVIVAGTTAIDSNVALSSTDNGVSWTPRALPNTQGWLTGTYGNGTYVVVGESANQTTGNNAATSSDGVTWTRREITTQRWNRIVYNDGVFLVTTNRTSLNTATRSFDNGVTWATVTLPRASQWYGASAGNNAIMLLTGNANASANCGIISTDNGDTWSNISLPAVGGGSTAWQWRNLAYGNGIFMAVANQANVANGALNVAVSSDNGATWSQSSTPVSGNASINFPSWVLGYGNGVFCIAEAGFVSDHTRAAISTDNGTTWTTKTLPAALNWNSIGYSNGTFIISGFNPSNTIVRSTDNGNNWTAVTLPSTNNWATVIGAS